MDVVRRIDGIEAADRMRWLAGDSWPAVYGSAHGATGYDPTDMWAAAVWVLHAMYEQPEIEPGLTHHELHQQAIAAGLREPTVVGDVNLDEITTTTGVPLGFGERPGPPWQRLTWSELGRRVGFEFWAVERQGPDLLHTPQRDWANPACMPLSSWPRLGPSAQSSWPAGVLPPPEGSLEEESLLSLIEILTQHASADALHDCVAYYSPVAFLNDGATVYTGDLHDVPTLVRCQRGTRFTPTNMWPADHSWLVYTDCDLSATRVSGSRALIEALCGATALETVRCCGDAAPPAGLANREDT